MSFQGKQIGEIPPMDEDIKVEDHMTHDVLAFTEGQSIIEAMESLVKNRISGAPVVNEKNEVIGIISEGDCIKQFSECRYYNQPLDNMNVENYMIKNVETIPPDMQLFDLANKFLSMKVRRFPVCEDGKLVGLISQKDILRAVLKLNGHKWK